MAKFMLLLHCAPDAMQRLSPDEKERATQKIAAWTEQMLKAGRLVSSEKLGDEGGQVVEVQEGGTRIVDGPYIETKEVIGGYVVLRAANYAEAVDLARDCPFLRLGRIAIRQTDPLGCGGE